MLKASDIPVRRDPTDEDARAALEGYLCDEGRMSELPAVLILYAWYRQQVEEDAEFTIHYALMVTMRYIQQVRHHTRKRTR